jgi:hypothetical protein
MSGSHFGSGYWPDDYFGLYFQPEAGGVIVGTLAGSFAGTSSFSGTLEQPVPVVAEYGGHYARDVFKRRRSKRERDDEIVDDLKRALGLLRPSPAAIVAPVVEVIAPHVEREIETVPAIKAIDWRPFIEEARKRQELRDAIAQAKARQDEEDEEMFMLMAA